MYFPESYPTCHRFLLPILNSTRSFPHPVRTDASFFTRLYVFPQGYRKKKKLYQSCVFRQKSCSPPSLSLSFSPSPVVPSRRRFRQSFAIRWGATNDHEFREATRIGVVPSHIGRRFPTLRQYDQVPRQSFCAYLHPVASRDVIRT